MPTCAAINCKNRQYGGCGKTFHRFPHSKPQDLKKWIIATRRDRFKPGHKAVLCSDHFENECFDCTGQTVRLKDGAVPTLFKFPAHLMRPPAIPRKPPKNRDTTPSAPPAQPSPPRPPPQSCSSNQCSLQSDHNYHVQQSPRTLKRQLDVCHQDMGKVRKRLKVAHQRERRLQRKIYSLQTIIEELRSKQIVR